MHWLKSINTILHARCFVISKVEILVFLRSYFEKCFSDNFRKPNSNRGNVELGNLVQCKIGEGLFKIWTNGENS